MTSDVTKARAEHSYAKDRIRPEEVEEVELTCLECGVIWDGYSEDGEPENCPREDCGSESVARA